MAEKVKMYENLIKVVHTLECDKCKVEMTLDPQVLTTWPAQYSYYCPICGHYEQSFSCYPYVEYIGELIETELVDMKDV